MSHSSNIIPTQMNNDNKLVGCYIFVIFFYSSSLLLDEKNCCRSLHAVQAERQGQAERSVLVSCHSKPSEKRFLKYLSRHGDIKKYFFYESYVCKNLLTNQHYFPNILLGWKLNCDDIVCNGVLLQGVYAVVEFANRESVASLLEEATIPISSHEAMVPYKSRLLSLKHLCSVNSLNQHSRQQCQPQTSIPINQLIQRLSREESVSDPALISSLNSKALIQHRTPIHV